MARLAGWGTKRGRVLRGQNVHIAIFIPGYHIRTVVLRLNIARIIKDNKLKIKQGFDLKCPNV